VDAGGGGAADGAAERRLEERRAQKLAALELRREDEVRGWVGVG
jgi:hypothetical protein